MNQEPWQAVLFDRIFAQAGSNNLASATLSTVPFVPVLDVTNAMASNTYTCKHAGVYRIIWGGLFTKTGASTAVAGDAWNLVTKKNGTTIEGTQQMEVDMTYATNFLIAVNTFVIVSLTVGDTIVCGCNYNAGGGRTWNGTFSSTNLTIGPA